MTKWFLYAGALIFGLALFLPSSGSTEIRNLPLLLAILSCIAAYFIYKFIALLILAYKIKSVLRKQGLQVKRTRLFFGKGYTVAESQNETFDVYFLLRKSKYYRYHFNTVNRLEHWKTTFAVAKSSKRGTIARGTADTRMVGWQELSWRQFVKERTVHRYIVINKLPNSISDAAHREELSEGDQICTSDIILLSLDGFRREILNSPDRAEKF